MNVKHLDITEVFVEIMANFPNKKRHAGTYGKSPNKIAAIFCKKPYLCQEKIFLAKNCRIAGLKLLEVLALHVNHSGLSYNKCMLSSLVLQG